MGCWEKAVMHAAERSRFSKHGEVDFILCNERLPAETDMKSIRISLTCWLWCKKARKGKDKRPQKTTRTLKKSLRTERRGV